MVITAVETVPYIGRCTACSRAYRADLSSSLPRIKAPNVAAGLTGCGCRSGVRCTGGENGLPACGDWDCSGHDPTEVSYRRLKAVYSAEAACGPGNCWNAITAKCACSCRGRNHGQFWAVTRSIRW